MEPKTERRDADNEVRLLSRAIAGSLEPGTIWAIVLAFIVLIFGLLLFAQTETAIGLEECNRQCAASGKEPVYIPSDMGSAELYAKVVANCVCR
jgi:hypothetical protein